MIAAIFDVDGTMVDNARFHEAAWIELCRRHGHPISAEFYQRHIHAQSNDKNVRTIFGAGVSRDFIERMSAEKEDIYRTTFRPVLREIPGLTALLQALNQRRIPCAAASNSPRENVDMVLDELNIRRYFRVVIHRELVTHGKPNPEILLTAARLLGFAPRQCVVFEDSLPGFQAAETAGMACIAITAGANPEELKHATHVRRMVPDFRSIDPDMLPDLLA